MRKFLKITGIILTTLIVLVVLGAILLVTVISPNRLKPVLADQVMKSTGRQLIIDGDMSWTFFPYLGIKMGHATLGNSPAFKQKVFAEISSATMGVELIPLFSGHIKSTGMVLQGMQLTLVRNANGQVNWDFSHPSDMSASADVATDENKSSTGSSHKGIRLAIAAVDVTNAKVIWDDQQNKQFYTVDHADFHAKDINLTQPFPVSAELDFAGKNPPVKGHVSLTSQLALNLDKQIYSLNDLTIAANVQKNNQTFNLKVAGNVVADLTQQTLQWTNFKGGIANVALTGAFNITHLSSAPNLVGQVQVKPFDLKELLKKIGQPVDNLEVAKDVKGNINFSGPIKSLNIKSIMTIGELQAEKIKMNNITVQARYSDSIVDITAFKASLYQGTAEGSGKVKLATIPQMALQAKLTNVQALPLLKDLNENKKQKITIAGAGNIDIQITTEGTTANAILSHLNGASRLSFNNGSLEGVDLGYLVDTAYATLKGKSHDITDHNKTNFGTLTATAVIHDGVVSNNDFVMDSPRFDTKGAGTVNLVAQKINYGLQLSVKQASSEQKDNVRNLYGVVIPVQINGAMDNPSVRLDTSALVKTVAEQQVKKAVSKVQEKIQEQIKGKVSDKAGDLLQNLLGH